MPNASGSQHQGGLHSTLDGFCSEKIPCATAVGEFTVHYHSERNHQGIGNLPHFPGEPVAPDRFAAQAVALAECSITMSGQRDQMPAHFSFSYITRVKIDNLAFSKLDDYPLCMAACSLTETSMAFLKRHEPVRFFVG